MRLILTVGVCLLLPLAVGMWLDQTVTQRPVATLLGAGVGMMVSTLIIVRSFCRTIGALAHPSSGSRLDENSEREWEGG